jgi:hypothetical protein
LKLKKFEVIVIAWMSFVNSVVLSVLLPIIAIGFVNWGIFIEGFVVSFAISFVLVLIIPVNVWGDKVAVACKTKPYSFPWALISTAVATLILATLMSLCMVAYFLPAEARPHFIFAWLGVYPYVLGAIYVASLIAAPIGVSIAKKMCGAPVQASIAQ